MVLDVVDDEDVISDDDSCVEDVSMEELSSMLDDSLVLVSLPVVSLLKHPVVSSNER